MPKKGEGRPGGEKSRGTRPSPHPFAKRGPRRAALEAILAHVGTLTTAAGADAVLATTGALAAGDYRIVAHLSDDGVVAAGKGVSLVHRNAADNADQKFLGGVSAADSSRIEIPRLTLAANERVTARASTVVHAANERTIAHIEAIAIPA